MANTATINPTSSDRALRNIGRIKRLKQSLEKDGITEERKASLQAELDRRVSEVEELKKALESV